MRYWKVIESYASYLIEGKIYVSNDNGKNLKGEYNYTYDEMNVANGEFETKFQEVTKEDYEKQCELDETEKDLEELYMGHETESEEESNIHPKHYQSCSVECIDVMLMTFGSQMTYDFCVLNAFKYIWRYKNKNGKEDLNKARYYVDYAYDISNMTESEGMYNQEAINIDMILKKIEKENGL